MSITSVTNNKPKKNDKPRSASCPRRSNDS
jgi:hypothetical protein